MVAKVVDEHDELIAAALEEVVRLQGNIPHIRDGRIEIPALTLPQEPKAAGQALSREAVSITARTVEAAAAAQRLSDALEIGYRGFGEIACTEAAREGISAFLEKRRAEFKK